MTQIKIPCPKCGHVATVEIATIDKLREELAAMTRERNIYKQRLAAVELRGASEGEDFVSRLRRMAGL